MYKLRTSLCKKKNTQRVVCYTEMFMPYLYIMYRTIALIYRPELVAFRTRDRNESNRTNDIYMYIADRFENS